MLLKLNEVDETGRFSFCKVIVRFFFLIAGERLAYLHHRVPSWQGLHCPSAALRLVVGTVVGFGLHLDLQIVRTWAGWQLPIKSREGWAAKLENKTVHQDVWITYTYAYTILQALIGWVKPDFRLAPGKRLGPGPLHFIIVFNLICCSHCLKYLISKVWQLIVIFFFF